MSIHLSPLNLETDYQQLADLMTRDSGLAVARRRLEFGNHGVARGTIRLQVVATAPCRRIVGFAEVMHERCMPDRQFHFQVVVEKGMRGRGIGSMLYDDLLQFAREQGAARLVVDVLDGAADGLRFATRRGFTVSDSDLARNAGSYRLVRDLW